MKLKTLVLIGMSLATLPAFAIDTVRIRNKASKLLHFEMRCLDTDSPWKQFEAESGDVREISAASCKEFSFRKTTKQRDGSSQTVNYKLMANNSYYLTYDANRDLFDLKKVRQTDF